MKAYLVSYDLDKPGQDYQDLIAELKKFGAIRVLYSQWVVQNEANAADLRDHFLKLIDSNDRFLVIEIAGASAWYNLMVGTQKFKEAIAA